MQDNKQLSHNSKSSKLQAFHPLAKKYGGDINKNELEALAKSIKEKGQDHPIIVHEGKIIDGIQRYRACLRAKIEPRFEPYDVKRYGGTEKDIEAFIIIQNIQRRHDSKRKRAFIRELLKADPTASNRKIAEAAKVDKNTVANQRRQMESTGEIPQLQKTTGKDGKTRTTTPKPPDKPPSPPAAPATIPSKVVEQPDGSVDVLPDLESTGALLLEAAQAFIENPEASAAQAHTLTELLPRLQQALFDLTAAAIAQAPAITTH